MFSWQSNGEQVFPMWLLCPGCQPGIGFLVFGVRAPQHFLFLLFLLVLLSLSWPEMLQ